MEEYVADFIVGLTGRSISDPGKDCDDEWSRLIWDVVEKLKDATFSRKNIREEGSKTFPRECGDFFCYLLNPQNIDARVDDYLVVTSEKSRRVADEAK